MVAKHKRYKKIIIPILLFFVIFAMVFIGIQFFTKTGMFKIPGVVIYDERLNAEEIALLENVFIDDLILEKDVQIIVDEVNILPSKIDSNEFISSIHVPVADFYETRNDISEFALDEFEYIPLSELDFKKKLLTINNEYYLDAFSSGAKFRIIKFISENFEKEIEPLIKPIFDREYPSKNTVLTFAQTGVTALSRGMNRKLYEVGDATYFSSGLKDFLSKHDLTHTSNESSFSDYASAANICSDMRFANTLLDIGLNIVELTGNHNQDCGDTAANNTIDFYNEHNIKIVGGGKSASDAAKPLLINEKGSGITFLAYNQSTGGATYDNTPGANQYYEENAAAEITAAKQRGDFVIVDIQYYECSMYASETEDTTCDYADSSAGDQVGFFRHLVDLGADLVVGTSAHQPQTFELYNNGAIYYGLGNLFFDQHWWPGTTRSLILSHYFYNGKLLQTKIIPTVYDGNLQTSLMKAENVGPFLKRLIDIRPSL